MKTLLTTFVALVLLASVGWTQPMVAQEYDLARSGEQLPGVVSFDFPLGATSVVTVPVINHTARVATVQILQPTAALATRFSGAISDASFELFASPYNVSSATANKPGIALAIRHATDTTTLQGTTLMQTKGLFNFILEGNRRYWLRYTGNALTAPVRVIIGFKD